MPIKTYYKVLDKVNYRPMWLIHNVYSENKNNIGDDIILTYHRNDGREIFVNDE